MDNYLPDGTHVGSYHCIEVQMPCPEGTLPGLLTRYRRVLGELEYAHPNLDGWMTELLDLFTEFEGPDDGIETFVHTPYPLREVYLGGQPLLAHGYALGYTTEMHTRLEVPWVEFSLNFDSHLVRGLDPDTFQYDFARNTVIEPGFYYHPGAADALWRIMRTFASLFPASAVVFTMEYWHGWDELLRGEKQNYGLFWDFDLALVPPALAGPFLPPNEQLVAYPRKDGLVVARRKVWREHPWAYEE